MGIQVSLAITMFFCLSGLWLGGQLYLSYFFKLVCYAHVFPCMYTIYMYMYMYVYNVCTSCIYIYVYFVFM